MSNTNFFFNFFFFANLKKKDFCDVQYQILGEIPTVWYAMKNLKTHACTFVLKLMQRVSPTGKKERGRGKKDCIFVYNC